MVRFIRWSLILCLGLVSCAAVQYRYYHLEGVDYSDPDAKLIGEKPEDDLPLKVCSPREDDANPCIVQLSEEFFAKDDELESCRVRLKECEKRCK